MASALSIALRRDDALRRIEEAMSNLGVSVEDDALRSRVADPEIREANRLEVIAGVLERVAANAGGAEDAPAEDVEAPHKPAKGGKK